MFALVAAVSAAVAIWGYRWLVRATAAIFAIGGILMVLMPIAFAGRIQWGYAGSEPVLGTFGATWLLVATTVGVGGALVVCTILGDWTRYIRSDLHPPRKLAPVAAAALFLGFAVPAAIGAIVSTAFTDPFAPFPVSLAAESPLWYAVPLLPFAILGGVGLVAQSLYSAGLDLEAVIVRITRARATVIIAVVGVVLVYLGLLAPTIQGAIGAALLVLAELSAPWAVIVGIDFLKTGGRYDADDLQVFNRGATGGRYWYSGGWHPGAVIAWAAGSIVGLLTIQTLIFSGPLSGHRPRGRRQPPAGRARRRADLPAAAQPRRPPGLTAPVPDPPCLTRSAPDRSTLVHTRRRPCTGRTMCTGRRRCARALVFVGAGREGG